MINFSCFGFLNLLDGNLWLYFQELMRFSFIFSIFTCLNQLFVEFLIAYFEYFISASKTLDLLRSLDLPFQIFENTVVSWLEQTMVL